ncbi:COX15/CtaA family protein [Acuticoccus sp. M5D2P5]|uniref:COX15/CtaA family protein n=1 Tax=Acuticoccus kalidii TaxID=2910977 RepID=UPI001F3C32A2|nr:COX15/CtaA family protein [Acuticoccus kalidii]MCF3934208.1 COX15/CtaA family protein [Acuticoccus kalidii]
MQNNAPLVWWLRIVALFVLATLVLGGATRITDSGLSITEWAPIIGVIPPMTDAAWERALEMYRQIPEYQLINRGMSMGEFQFIYWWEWSHRLVARAIGIVFAVPLAFFWARGQLPVWLKPWAILLLALGGLQGAVGWWMVTSGLVDRVDVSQYRLATHLTLACIILMITVWLSVRLSGRAGRVEAPGSVRVGAIAIAYAVLAQIFLGALVAGLDAGHASDTWPLMQGRIIPEGMWVLEPTWINVFENHLTVQFDHRVFAYLLTILVVWHVVGAVRAEAGKGLALAIFGLLVLQLAVGIGVIVMRVPPYLAAFHQLVAAVLLWVAVVHATHFASAREKAAARLVRAAA